MSSIGKVMNAMIGYYAGDVRRINHFLKVYGFAKAIGESEGLDEATQKILEIAALTHDIGIRNSEKKYNSSAGDLQQTEGPPEAKKMLTGLGLDPLLIDRVCWLIAHHHTYTDMPDIDYRILIEADFLVNAFEDDFSKSSIQAFERKNFMTDSGKSFLHELYSLD